MARKKIDPKVKQLVKDFLEVYDPKTAGDITSGLKDLLGPVIQDMMEAEFEDHMGYDKNSHEEKDTDNRRNGSYPKTLKSTFGEFGIDVPRDRDASFEPDVVPKGQRDISGIEEKIIAMYGKGMSQRDISDTVQDIYGFSASHELISNVTDKIMDRINDWQNRPLQACYPFVFVDCMYVTVKDTIKTTKRAIYTILGYNVKGFKDILGVWIGEESESAHFWLNIFDELKTRGVEDIFFMSMDGLTGLEKGVNTIFPNAVVQRCIVHLIRNAIKFVPSKDYKEFTKDLKTVYQATNLEEATHNFIKFKENWEKYNGAIGVFERNWKHIEQLFDYPKAIRKLMYTTNAIESVHSSFRKVTDRKGAFPNDKALIKLIFLRIQDMSKKWTKPIQNWPTVLNEFLIIDQFKERITKYL
jgi:transposase-like protein